DYYCQTWTGDIGLS
nr:immunoglobulin light chain junction region [Macaca mulatta]